MMSTAPLRKWMIWKDCLLIVMFFVWFGTVEATRDDSEIHEQNIKYTLDTVKLTKKAGVIVS